MSDYSIDLSRLQVKKRQTLFLADVFDRLAQRGEGSDFARRAALCRNCGNYLKFGILVDGSSKIVDANFCRQRLCPSCAFRRSHKAYSNISRVLDFVEQNSNNQFLFLTLTIRNVSGLNLSSALDAMAIGFKRFLDAKGKSGRFSGVIRTTEVTVSDDGSFHPHYHCILAVPPSYFSRAAGLYWTTSDFSRAWRECLGIEYDPVVDVRAVFTREGSIKEVAKYAVKPSSLFSGGPLDVEERVLYLQRGLHRRRLLSYTGVFGEARRALAIPEEDEDGLTDSISRADVFRCFVVYHWGFGVSAYTLEKEEIIHDRKTN